MILNISYPVPDGMNPAELRDLMEGSEVRDPASGVIGKVIHANCTWDGVDHPGTGNDHRSIVRLTLEIDDKSAVAAATRKGPIF